MLTRTLPSSQTDPDFHEQWENEGAINEIQEHVDERGFYLYEWISPDELRMSVQADYLSIVKKASMPLAILTVIAGFLGLGAGIIGAIGAIIVMLGLFYTFVFLYLIAKMIRKSYLYTRGADVVITDHHYISGGHVVEKSDFNGQRQAFENMETYFKEPIFEPSQLKDYIALEKKGLFDQLKDIALGGGKVIEKIGRSRDAGGIIVVILLAGVLYGGMMAGVYLIGVFFVALIARLFSLIAHYILLAVNNTEHEIQTLFGAVSGSSIELKNEKKGVISLLTSASQNEWKENLSGKLEESFTLINEHAKIATDQSLKLQKLLNNSQYKDIFNFVKYGTWIKKQILEPIESILLLLEKNRAILSKTILSLEEESKTTADPSLQKPLILQKERLKIQRESFDRNIKLLNSYKEKLT